MMIVKRVRAKELLTIPVPFEVRFSSGWKTIDKVERHYDPKAPDVPRVKLLNNEKLVAWFYLSTEVTVKQWDL